MQTPTTEEIPKKNPHRTPNGILTMHLTRAFVSFRRSVCMYYKNMKIFVQSIRLSPVLPASTIES